MSKHEPTTTTASKNRRRSRRQQPKGSTRVTIYPNRMGLGKNIATQLLDVSETGIRAVVLCELAVASEVEINIDSPGCEKLKLLAKIVWSVPTADGHFVIGAEFGKAIRHADLHRLTRP
jgi:hypothetical protein